MAGDPREPYGQIFHEQGRLTVNAEREKPFAVGKWEDRTDEQREIDMRGSSAVAAQAVADAKVRNERLEAQVFALAAITPDLRRALIIAITAATYEAEAKPFRRAMEMLGGSEEGTGNA